MKSNPSDTKSNSKYIDLEIFYSQISKKDIQLIQNALATTYIDALDIIIVGELELPKEAYNTQKDQYNADILLTYL